MATFTTTGKSGLATNDQKLKIGDGDYYLSIDATYSLLIQEAGSAITWTAGTKN